jgi:hypothetical protein
MTGAAADQWAAHGVLNSILLAKPFAPAPRLAGVVRSGALFRYPCSLAAITSVHAQAITIPGAEHRAHEDSPLAATRADWLQRRIGIFSLHALER